MKLSVVKKSVVLSAFSSCFVALACSAQDPPADPGGSGAASGTSGSSGAGGAGKGGSAGTSGAGGSVAGAGGSVGGSAGSTATGGSSGGGASGAGGSQAGAGMTAGGAAGTAAGSAGTTNGGAGSGGIAGGGTGGDTAGASGTSAGTAGTSAGSGGTGGGNATPSPGCESGMGRPQGGTVTTSNYYFTFPESYDGQTPLPVIMGFHGCGAGNRGTGLSSTEFVRLTRNTPFEDEYVVAVPISQDSGGCWNYNNDLPRIKTMYDDLVENHCVDTSRVFATGHSSGANLICEIQNTQHTADAEYLGFKGVAPVSGIPQTIGTPVAVMYIQGIMDSERGNSDGADVVQRFRAGNMCMDTYTAYAEVEGCQSNYNQATVDPGCRLYDGCDIKTVWCRHNDGDYGGTMHGVPCFAMQGMYDFFESLP